MPIPCRKCAQLIPDQSAYCLFCGAPQAAPARAQRTKHRGNGQGSVYKLPSGRWRARVTLGYYWDDLAQKRKRKTRSRDFVKKSDAIAALPSLLQQSQRPRDMSLADLYAEYTAGKDFAALSKSQRDKLGYAWARLSPLQFLGIASLTVDDMQSAIDAAVSTYYPARDMKVMLSHLYGLAVRKEIVPLNKSEYIDLPQSPQAKRETWTVQEVAAMWRDYPAHPFTGYLLIMCYAGLRYGELAAMALENIHLAEGYMIGGIKTQAGINREIPLCQKIRPVIGQLMSGRRRHLLEMNEDRFYSAYWDVIDNRLSLRHLPPHTCRHYYFSQLTAAGVQGGIIAEVGGHADYSTTMKNYVRISLPDKIAAVESIP